MKVQSSSNLSHFMLAPDHTFTIAELNQAARVLLEQAFASVWVEGEISNLSRPASGHLYFSLKDREAQIACALFKGSRYGLKIPVGQLENGLAIRAHGRLTLYEARGSYQLIIDQIEPVGQGALERAFAELQAQLAAEGLFAASRKRLIPAHPRQIGIITSPSGAAIHDALTTLARRNPLIPVIVYPSAVQGENAHLELIRQLHTANRRRECDTLLLIRGGGSLEDLWSFNHPDLVRAIVASEIPVVSGVGHETDVTLADLAADLRAPTPTAAAEMACPPLQQARQALAQYQRSLARQSQILLGNARRRTEELAHRLQLQHPERRLQQRAQQLDDYQERLTRSIARRVQQPQQQLSQQHERLQRAIAQQMRARRSHFEHLIAQLHALSPLATLKRGYAIARHANGEVIDDIQQTRPQEDIHIQLARGKLICTVRQRRQTPPPD